MRKSVPVALVLVAVIIATWVMPVQAVHIFDYVNALRNNGNTSNDILHHAVIDHVYLPNGNVTAYVYSGANQHLDVNQFTGLTPQTWEDSERKLTHFVFELTNRYKPNAAIVISLREKEQGIVHLYVYGQQKNQAMFSIVSGLRDCYGSAPYSWSLGSGSSSNSWINKVSPEVVTQNPIVSFQVVAFTISQNTYLFNGKEKTMDVKPYVKDSRTYVPVRYLAYALGVQEENITWTQESQKVTVVKDDTTVEMSIGNDTMLVNDKAILMDVAPELKDDRTMLPARWLAEAFGAEVKWDDKTKQATIKIAQPGD